MVVLEEVLLPILLAHLVVEVVVDLGVLGTMVLIAHLVVEVVVAMED
jgi:hypothetical protein